MNFVSLTYDDRSPMTAGKRISEVYRDVSKNSPETKVRQR